MLRDTGKLTNGISQLFPPIRMERAISVIQKKNLRRIAQTSV